MKYHTIFVDWYGTLSNSLFWEHWASDPARMSDHQLIQDRFFKASPQLILDWMRAEISTDQILDLISDRTGIKVQDLQDGLKHSCETMNLINPEILDVVAAIRGNGTCLVIATDNVDTFTRWTVPALGLLDHFDESLNSYELGALKKDSTIDKRSKFFGDYFARHDVDPSDTLLVDDLVENLAIEAFGMSFQQVTPSKSALSILKSL